MTIPIEPFAPYTRERDWGTEQIVVEMPGLVGKVLRYEAGKAGGLQLHRIRREAFHLVEGYARVSFVDDEGTLVTQYMEAGETFIIPPGAPHKFEAVTDCLVVEVSDSAAEDRVRLESAYGLPDPGGLPTTSARHPRMPPPPPWSPRVPDSAGPSVESPGSGVVLVIIGVMITIVILLGMGLR